MRVMRTPRHVDIEVTGRCNLHCRHCYRGGASVGRELSTEEWCRFFGELGECAVMTVCLGGGEPFLRSDLPALVVAVCVNGMRFQMVTNGGLIDERAAAAVAEGCRCDSVQISLGSCAGPAVGADDEVILTVRERERAMATLLALAELYPGRVTANAGPLAEARAWSRMEAARRAEQPEFPEGGRLTGCGCSSQQIAVRADGVYIPCLLLPEIELGRVNVDPMRTVWASAPALQAMRRRREVALADLAECTGCAYAPYCTGNCPAVVLGAGGGFETPALDSCLRRFVEAGGQVPELAVEHR